MINIIDTTLIFIFTLILFSFLLGMFLFFIKMGNLFIFQEVEFSRKSVIISVILSGVLSIPVLLKILIGY